VLWVPPYGVGVSLQDSSASRGDGWSNGGLLELQSFQGETLVRRYFQGGQLGAVLRGVKGGGDECGGSLCRPCASERGPSQCS
jgi:hypothetical protein